MTRGRGQLVLLAAAVVVTALVPMLLAYAQLGYVADAPGPGDHRATVTDARRTLERAVASATTSAGGEADVGRHGTVAGLATARLDPAVAAVEESGTDDAVTVGVAYNDTAASAWADDRCPGGPARRFGPCIATDGVVTQNRADLTALVAVAFDVRVRGPDGTTRVTLVIRGVRGAVADG